MYNDILKVKLEESAVSEEIEAEWRADGDTIGRALELMGRLEGFVVDIKEATSACTGLAQASLRWKKRVDKAASLPCPKGIKRLLKLMKSTGTEKGKDKDKDKEKESSTVRDSSCLLAEEHLQIICVTVSLMVSELMSLLSLGRYGLATGKNVHLMKNIEHLAMCGLSVQKCVPSLSPIEAQIDSLLPRAELSSELAQTDEGVHDVLVQMFRTSFHTRHLTVGMAADSCVTVALAAAELCLAVKQIIKLCDQDFKKDLQRNAKQREQQDDMCEEDKAFMAEMAKQQQEASREQAQERAAEKEQEEERHREEGTEMEYLRGQVHSLQVQLRLQNMEALQTLNADVCEMQRKVQGHVSEVTVLDTVPVPVSSGNSSNGNSNSNSNGNSNSNETNKDRAKTEKSTNTSTSTLTGSAELPMDPQSQSLLSLLGEFMDSSCLCYRNRRAGRPPLVVTSAEVADPDLVMNLFDLSFGWMFALGKRQLGSSGSSGSRGNSGSGSGSGSSGSGSSGSGSGSGSGSSGSGSGSDSTSQSASASPDEEGVGEEASPESAAPLPLPEQHQEQHQEQEQEEGKEEEQEQKRGSSAAASHRRLALLPDFRSKVLWVCALLRPEEVRAIIRHEFHARLLDCLRSSVSFTHTDTTDVVASSDLSVGGAEQCGREEEEEEGDRRHKELASAVCGCLLQGVDSAVADMR
jgi:hypothetical protein